MQDVFSWFSRVSSGVVQVLVAWFAVDPHRCNLTELSVLLGDMFPEFLVGIYAANVLTYSYDHVAYLAYPERDGALGVIYRECIGVEVDFEEQLRDLVQHKYTYAIGVAWRRKHLAPLYAHVQCGGDGRTRLDLPTTVYACGLQADYDRHLLPIRLEREFSLLDALRGACSAGNLEPSTTHVIGSSNGCCEIIDVTYLAAACTHGLKMEQHHFEEAAAHYKAFRCDAGADEYHVTLTDLMDEAWKTILRTALQANLSVDWSRHCRIVSIDEDLNNRGGRDYADIMSDAYDAGHVIPSLEHFQTAHFVDAYMLTAAWLRPEFPFRKQDVSLCMASPDDDFAEPEDAIWYRIVQSSIYVPSFEELLQTVDGAHGVLALIKHHGFVPTYDQLALCLVADPTLDLCLEAYKHSMVPDYGLHVKLCQSKHDALGHHQWEDIAHDLDVMYGTGLKPEARHGVRLFDDGEDGEDGEDGVTDVKVKHWRRRYAAQVIRTVYLRHYYKPEGVGGHKILGELAQDSAMDC